MVGAADGAAGDVAGDAIGEVIAAFVARFPARIHSCYTLGSYADASAIAASDLDLTIVFAGALSDAERAAAAALAASCAESSAVELDIELTDERELAAGASPNFKSGSALVYGEDIRERTPLMSLPAWTRDRMHSSWWRIARLFARPAVIALPLEYPEPADAFRGYTRRMLRMPDGAAVPCTRDLIRLVGWAATGLLALQCGVYAARKRDVHTLYRERIGGEWAELVAETYTLCRQRWGYLIPDAPVERIQVQRLCDQMLGFERAFAAIYRPYLLGELASADPAAARFAAEVMARAPLRDDAVIAALETISARSNDEQSATQARAALERVKSETAAKRSRP
ncbi:MAG TPA: hypothetical protein VFX31_01325 [Ktedonobacterales bacterium]|nr:hypothetical protein [Ktedonobacterales bacterium]HEX5569996.1 hypothetical protein [Ktedonobacterales bacterium]